MPIYQKDAKNQEDETNTDQKKATKGQTNATITTNDIK